MVMSEVIREISLDLNDQEMGYEYTRWTIDQLKNYVQEGLSIIGRPLKSLFSADFIIEIDPGAGWQVACDCTVIERIVGETDSYGNVIQYLSRSLDKEENTWAGRPQRCINNPNAYRMIGYTVSEDDQNEFRIYPPAPPGIKRYVWVKCFKAPTSFSFDDDIPGEVVPIIKQCLI